MGNYLLMGYAAGLVALGVLVVHLWRATTPPVLGMSVGGHPGGPPAGEQQPPPAPAPPAAPAVVHGTEEELARRLRTEIETRPEAFPMLPRPVTVYDRIGGRDTVRAVVEQLFARLMTDPVTAPYFAGHDVGRIKHHLRHLLTVLAIGDTPHPDAEESWSVLAGLGAGRRLGVRPMLERRHFGLAITDRAYDRLEVHTAEALVGAGVRERAERVALLEALASFRVDVVTSRPVPVLADEVPPE